MFLGFDFSPLGLFVHAITGVIGLALELLADTLTGALNGLLGVE